MSKTSRSSQLAAAHTPETDGTAVAVGHAGLHPDARARSVVEYRQ